MNVADLHVDPDPRAVADLIDSGGMVFARERWGWLDQTTLSRMARAGRQATGRKIPTGNLHDSEGHIYLNKAWDGLMADRLGVPAAAEALGLSAATITRGNA